MQTKNQKYDTEHRDTAICPHCGHPHRDMWDVNFGPGIEGDREMDCGECGKTFFVSKYATITYTTRLLPNEKS
jgi:ribosomal protein S27AE